MKNRRQFCASLAGCLSLMLMGRRPTVGPPCPCRPRKKKKQTGNEE